MFTICLSIHKFFVLFACSQILWLVCLFTSHLFVYSQAGCFSSLFIFQNLFLLEFEQHTVLGAMVKFFVFWKNLIKKLFAPLPWKSCLSYGSLLNWKYLMFVIFFRKTRFLSIGFGYYQLDKPGILLFSFHFKSYSDMTELLKSDKI